MLRLDISAAARSRLQSGEAAITPSLMWSPTRSVSGSSPAPRESRMSRSVTMQGTGVSSSSTSAAPIPLAAICTAASRRVCVGPTVRTTSDMPSLTNIGRPLFDRCAVREDRLKPTRREGPPIRFDGGLAYRLRRASRRPMIKLPTPIRPLLALAAMAAVALGASACGTSTADVENGRILFIERCGTCHTLAEAGTTATVGPNLDDAFSAAREAGEGGETIEGVVEAQVEFPRPSTEDPSISMPADVVKGQELEDVAAYVGKWAGVPGAAPPKVPGGPGAQVFANNGCGGCHTLAAAQSGGTVGPDLNEVLSGQSAAMVHEDIVDPNKVIAPGFPASVMPLNFEETLSPEELEDLVQFLVESTGGEGGAPQGGKAGGSKSKGG